MKILLVFISVIIIYYYIKKQNCEREIKKKTKSYLFLNKIDALVYYQFIF